MNDLSNLSIGGVVLFWACLGFLAIVGAYITWIVPFRILSLLRELVNEAREQTALLRKLAANRADAEPSDRAEELTASSNARVRIPGIN